MSAAPRGRRRGIGDAFSKSFRDRNPYAVGSISILVTMAIVGFAFAYGVLHLFTYQYPVRATFSDTAGLKAGDNVRVAGVKVGRVSSVEADRVHGDIVVNLVITDKNAAQLGPATHAEVALETLLGTKFVRLSGPVAPPYLPRHGMIPIERTTTPFDIFDLTKSATQNIDATDTDKLNHLITELADVTQGKQAQVAQLIQGVAQVSAAINSRDAQLTQLLDRSNQLTGTLAEKDQTLVALLDQSQGILELVDRRKQDIAAALTNGNSLVVELARILGVDKANLDRLLNSLAPVLQTVSQNQTNIDKALSIVGPGALGLGTSSSLGPWQEIFIKAVGPDVPGLLCQLPGLAGQAVCGSKPPGP